MIGAIHKKPVVQQDLSNEGETALKKQLDKVKLDKSRNIGC